MGIVVMLNNLFHDFAVALLAASLFVLFYVYRSIGPDRGRESLEVVKHLYGRMNRIIVGCWIVIILGGIGRTLAFGQYEWMEAAGRGQIAALVVKHIILVSLVVAGTVIQRRLKKVVAA